ncbi:MAG: response regulator transcription factor [Eubacterium sp.]|nr:response regulator transcription factor [Eubacterium sp.]
MLHIAVCDDEREMSDYLKTLVSDFFRKKNREICVRTFGSAEELLDYDGPVDILFLDIQMKGLDGMAAAKKLRAGRFRGILIFITVLKEMVFQSFEVQAFDYLLKPVEEKQFVKTMERLYASIRNASEDSLLVQKGYGGRIIRKDEIIFCEIIDRKVYLHLESGEVVDYYERIENLESLLHGHFFRCHRSYLIHLKHLKGYKNGTAYMDNGREIPVSRLRSREFSGVVLQYMKNR